MPYVRVHVDACDVLEELDTDDLKKELGRRVARGETSAAPDPEDVAAVLFDLSIAIHTGAAEARILELARLACEAGGHSPLPPPVRTPA